MKRASRVLFAAALVFCAVAPVSADYKQAFREGVRAYSKGQWAIVAANMKAAIGETPRSSESISISGGWSEQYLPHYFLAAALANLGQCDDAHDALRDAGDDSGGDKYKKVVEAKCGVLAMAPLPAELEAHKAEDLRKREDRRIADAVDAKRTADAREARLMADEAEAKRIAEAMEAKRMADAAEAKRIADEAEAKYADAKLAPQPRAPVVMTPAPSTASPDGPMQPASIAFNTPETMNVGEQYVIQLLLDRHLPEPQLRAEVKEAGKVSSAKVKVTSRMKAHLTGSAFEIRAITEEEQGISEADTTEWQWEVRPTREGKHRLFLTLDAIFGVGPQEVRRSLRTFDRAIEVGVLNRSAPPPAPRPAGQPVVWIVIAIAVAASVAALMWSRRKAPNHSPADAPTAILRGPTFAVGETVANRYRIQRLLGKGGMGAVYAAEDLELDNEIVAVKTILPTHEDPERALARFKREMQLARRVTHRNVSKVFDIGFDETGGERQIFVTMEYVDGQPLSHLIRTKGRMSETEALPLIREIAAGLAATHECGLIHRDIKTANIMVTADGRAILMDFGLACLYDDETTLPSLTRTGAVVGSPMYMAPEQIEGAALTPATDIYSFGVVIYEMVTGRLPFEGGEAISVIAKRLREEPVSPAQHAPDLDENWVATILRCLERDPGRRYQSALAVPEALTTSSRETQAL